MGSESLLLDIELCLPPYRVENQRNWLHWRRRCHYISIRVASESILFDAIHRYYNWCYIFLGYRGRTSNIVEGSEKFWLWGRNNSRISHKSHQIWGITSAIQRQAGPTARHWYNNQTDGIRSEDNSESAWNDPDDLPWMQLPSHHRSAGSLEPAYLRYQSSKRHNSKSMR